MPLCGTKKSKKQKRDPSPPFVRADDILKEKEALERKCRESKGEIEDLQEELKEAKRSRERLQGQVADLKKELEESKKVKPETIVAVSNDSELKSTYEAKLEQVQLEISEQMKKSEAAAERTKALEAEVKQAQKYLETERESKLKVEEEKNRLKKIKERLETDLSLRTQELEAVNEEKSQRSPTREPTVEWKSKIQTAEHELQKERDQRMEKEREISRVASEKAQLQKEAESLRSEMMKLKLIKNEQDGVSIEHQKNTENKESNLRLEIERLQERLRKESEEKDTLLSRLSNAMGSQVLDNNPSITDLSDPNRPIKLGEAMGQLYDDEWSDASEALSDLGKSEEEVTKILLDLLIATYKHCQEAAENQLARIEENIFLPPIDSDTSPAPHSPPAQNGQELKSPTSSKSASRIPRYSSKSSRPAIGGLALDKKETDGNGKPKEGKQPKRILAFPRHPPKGDKSIEIPLELKKGVKEFRKTVSKQVIPVIEKEVLNKLRGKPEFGEEIVRRCETYIKKAVELCWLMRIQDPPVHISWDVPNDGKFDTDLYRHYTKSGKHTDFVVWPAIYLHEGGPLMAKGVAQGKA